MERLLKTRRNAALELVEIERHAYPSGDPLTRRSGITEPLANQLLDMLWDALVELGTRSEVPSIPSQAAWKEITTAVWPFTDGMSLANGLSNMIQVDEHGHGFGVYTHGEFVIPRFANKDEAEQAVRESRLELESLLLSEQSRRLHPRLQEAVQIIEPMTAQLDEVRPRPLLLQTRCELCVV